MARTAAPRKRAATGVFSLKVTLRDTKPPIWRRIVVPGRMTLGDLHVAIQVTMGWENAHLHVFGVGDDRYGDPDITDNVADENRVTIDDVIKSGVSRFTYTYDFGDDWQHVVLIEKELPVNAATEAPACVAGKGKCPPEDCGGTFGYYDLLDILADPAHPQYEEQREWVGEDFDPEAFSVATADAALGEVFRRKSMT